MKFRGLGFTSADHDEDFRHQEVLGAFTNSNLKWAMTTLGIQLPPYKEKMVEVKDEEGQVVKDELGQPRLKRKLCPYDKDDMIESCMAWLYLPKAIKE